MDTKFVYGCSGGLAWPRLVTFQEPESGVLMQLASSVTSRAVLSVREECRGELGEKGAA